MTTHIDHEINYEDAQKALDIFNNMPNKEKKELFMRQNDSVFIFKPHKINDPTISNKRIFFCKRKGLFKYEIWCKFQMERSPEYKIFNFRFFSKKNAETTVNFLNLAYDSGTLYGWTKYNSGEKHDI